MMEDHLTIEARGLGLDYYSHPIFELLKDLQSFYDFLSYRSCDYFKGILLTGKIVSSSIFESIAATIESIYILTYIGHLNDAFSLIRKLEDALFLSLFIGCEIDEAELKIACTSISIREIIVNNKVAKWCKTGGKLYNNLEDLLKKIHIDAELRSLLNLDSQEKNSKNKEERQKCNDNVHYNSLRTFEINNNNCRDKSIYLNQLFNIVVRLLTENFSLLYCIHPEYYSSEDYGFSLDEGDIPEEGSQYWVASIVQDVFDKYIKPYDKSIADYLINKDLMNLE